MKPKDPESKNSFSAIELPLDCRRGSNHRRCLSLRSPKISLPHQKLANLISSCAMAVGKCRSFKFNKGKFNSIVSRT